jgi:hypothetical protein
MKNKNFFFKKNKSSREASRAYFGEKAEKASFIELDSAWTGV